MSKPNGKPELVLHLEVEFVDETGKKHAFKMPITWAAARALTEIGWNPKEACVSEERIAKMSDLDAVRIIHTGITLAGADWTEDEVGEAIVRGGFIHYAATVGMYLAGFLNGGVPLGLKPADFLDEEFGGAKKKSPSRGRGGRGSATPTKSRSRSGGSSRRSSGK